MRTTKQLLAALTKQVCTDTMPKSSRLMLTTDFDLRGMSPKQDVVANTPLCGGWMAFVNRKRTLAHVMHVDDTESYARIKLATNLKNTTDEYLRQYLYKRMKHHYIF